MPRISKKMVQNQDFEHIMSLEEKYYPMISSFLICCKIMICRPFLVTLAIKCLGLGEGVKNACKCESFEVNNLKNVGKKIQSGFLSPK